jgi:predicted transcriptional regulator
MSTAISVRISDELASKFAEISKEKERPKSFHIQKALETGDDVVLKRIKKGTNRQEQIEAGIWVKATGVELSEYVILEQIRSAMKQEESTFRPFFVGTE